MEYALTATKNKARAGSYYDRIARFYDLTFKFNGYARSLDQYFANHPLPVSRGDKILDAGCGTGLLTLALLRAIRFPVSITALDMPTRSNSARRGNSRYLRSSPIASRMTREMMLVGPLEYRHVVPVYGRAQARQAR